jgi:hypothetical protein
MTAGSTWIEAIRYDAAAEGVVGTIQRKDNLVWESRIDIDEVGLGH